MGISSRSAGACLAIGTLALLLTAAGVRAQQPTPDQTSAIRSSCRSDFMANCSGVTPGGKDALDCLKRNLAKLSGSCKTAVSAIMPAPVAAAPPPAPAAATPPPAQAATPAMAPAPPATAKPATAAAPKPAPKPTTAAVMPAAPAAAAPAPGFPPLGPVRPMLPQRALVIKAICHADEQTLCAGVPPIGSAVLSCLAQNGPHLAPECYKALAPVTMGR